MIHRDLKPSNILVDERGNPHVLDFGLAKAAGGFGLGVSMLSVSGEIKGTLPYMSPEQAAGRNELIDVRTDVYSIGIVIYRALVDCFPYEVNGPTASVLRNIESTEPKSLRQIVPKFDKDVDAIALKCLEKNPSKRYHSAADLEDDIQNWLSGRPLTAKCQNITYVLGKKLVRHRRSAAIVGLLGVIVMSFGLRAMQISDNRRRSQELERLANQQLDSMVSTVGTNMPWTIFLDFLEKWHSGHTMGLNWSTVALGSEEKIKEYAAMSFLITIDDDNSEELNFGDQLKNDEQWFADFVVGEAYLRMNDRERALAAYRRSHEVFDKVSRSDVSGDGAFKRLVILRLDELETDAGKAESNSLGVEQHGNDDSK